MAEGTVVLPPDSTGKTLRTQTNAGVASGAHQEVQTIALSDGTLVDPRAIRALTAADIVTIVQRCATAVASSVTATTTTGTMLASNASRAGATFYNEGPNILYLHCGGAASLTAYTVQVPVGALFEVPFGYTGICTGITLAGTAVTRIVEMT